MQDVVDEIAREHLRLVKVKEGFVAAACPFHKGGQERRPSFWINRLNGEWGCFACAEHGSNLKSLMQALGFKSRKLEVVIEEAVRDAKQNRNIEKARRRKKAKAEFRGVHVLPDALLGVYDWTPVKLIEEGFDEEILIAHDIGFDRERERITFPIRDLYGNLIGISGRTVKLDGYPKYKVYEGVTEKDGIKASGELGEWFPDYTNEGIRDHLWRANFVFKDIYEDRSKQLIVVEGYKAAMWLVQQGWFNVVALMGSRMSYAQQRLVCRMGTETWIFLDNNEAGISGTETIQDRLGSTTFPVYLCQYPSDYDEDCQPSDLGGDEIESILSGAVRARGRYKHAGGNQRKLS